MARTSSGWNEMTEVLNKYPERFMIEAHPTDDHVDGYLTTAGRPTLERARRLNFEGIYLPRGKAIPRVHRFFASGDVLS